MMSSAKNDPCARRLISVTIVAEMPCIFCFKKPRSNFSLENVFFFCFNIVFFLGEQFQLIEDLVWLS